MTKAQTTTDEFVLQLDEEVEAMQATIMSLKSKLEHSDKRVKELEDQLEGRSPGRRKNPRRKLLMSPLVSFPRSLLICNFKLATTYYTPEQLSEYYDQLISAGYMTKEQAKEALDQVALLHSLQIFQAIPRPNLK